MTSRPPDEAIVDALPTRGGPSWAMSTHGRRGDPPTISTGQHVRAIVDQQTEDTQQDTTHSALSFSLVLMTPTAQAVMHAAYDVLAVIRLLGSGWMFSWCPPQQPWLLPERAGSRAGTLTILPTPRQQCQTAPLLHDTFISRRIPTGQALVPQFPVLGGQRLTSHHPSSSTTPGGFVALSHDI